MAAAVRASRRAGGEALPPGGRVRLRFVGREGVWFAT